MVLLEFSMTPLGKGDSVSAYVARCLKIVDASGLDYRLHAMGTILEGDFDAVMRVVRLCLDELAADCDRVSCSMKLDYRRGAAGRLASKVQSVERFFDHPLKTH